MKILRSQVTSLADALLNMDGDPKKPNKFSVKTRYSLAKNLRLLTSRAQDIEQERQDIIRSIAPKDYAVKQNTPEMVEFTNRWESYLHGTKEQPAMEDFPNLMRFTLSELNLDVNDIPIAALAKLGPILIEDDVEPATTT